GRSRSRPRSRSRRTISQPAAHIPRPTTNVVVSTTLGSSPVLTQNPTSPLRTARMPNMLAASTSSPRRRRIWPAERVMAGSLFRGSWVVSRGSQRPVPTIHDPRLTTHDWGSDLRQLVPLPRLAGEEGVGLGVVGEGVAGGVPGKLAAEL